MRSRSARDNPDRRSGQRRFLVVDIEQDGGNNSSAPEPGTRLVTGDRVVLYGSDEAYCALYEETSTRRQ